MAESTIEQKTKREYNKIKKYFKDLDVPNKVILDGLMQNAAYMKVILDELQAAISEHGVCDEYQNGAAQKGTKLTPEAQAYNSFIKNYNAVIKHLQEYIPAGTPEKSKLSRFLDGDD